VPLNSLALGAMRPEQMSNASGIFNLMRNVGGSVGISLVTTLAARSAQAHQVVLATHLTPYDPAYQTTMRAMQGAMAVQAGAVDAQQQAVGAMYRLLEQQSNFLAYLDNFRWFGLLCVACIAATFLLKKTKMRGPVAAH